MRKTIIIVSLIVCFAISAPLFCQSDDSDISYTQEYIAAMTKKPGAERIKAFEAYVKKFTDTTQKFTRLAYYWIAMDNFQAQNFSQAASVGKKCLEFNGFEKGEEARLNLMLGNSYAVKSAPIYNKDQALKYINKAIAITQTTRDLNDVKQAAQDLKQKLTTPPPPSETPKQKIKRLVLQDEDFAEAISTYAGMKAADKQDIEVRRLYGMALMSSSKYSQAVEVFKALLDSEKSARFAYRLGQVYTEMSKRNSKYFDPSIRYLIEGGLRYQAEDNPANGKIALTKAEHQLFTKNGYFRKMDQYNAKLRSQQNSASRNQAEITRLKREEFKQKRNIRRNYTSIDLAPPPYELDKLAQIQKKLRMAQSGATSDSTQEMEALKKEETRIKADFRERVATIKKELEI